MFLKEKGIKKRRKIQNGTHAREAVSWGPPAPGKVSKKACTSILTKGLR